MDKFQCNFETWRWKNGIITFKSKRANNVFYETPNGFFKDVFIENSSNKFVLRLNKVIFRKNEILFRFNKSSQKIPKFLNNTVIQFSKKDEIIDSNIKSKIKLLPSNQTILLNPEIKKENIGIAIPIQNNNDIQKKEITIQNINNISVKNQIKSEISIQNIRSRSPSPVRNPYIYTNVESGYSARSFPQVFVQRYRYGPQGDKFQTTPQVAPVYSPR